MTDSGPLVWFNGAQVLAQATATDDFFDLKQFLAADRALHYGHGVFETIRVVKGRMVFLDLHLSRMRQGLLALNLATPASADEVFLPQIRRQLTGLALPVSEGMLKILVSAGSDDVGGYAQQGHQPILDTIYRWTALPVHAQVSTGLKMISCSHRLAHQPDLAGFKHLNRLDQVLCATQVKQAGFDEGLVCDSFGSPIEATASNLFIVSDGKLITPCLDRAGVAGVLRTAIINANDADVPRVFVERVSLSDVLEAEEVFLTNVIRGVRSVASLNCDGKVYHFRQEAVSKRLSQWFENQLG